MADENKVPSRVKFQCVDCERCCIVEWFDDGIDVCRMTCPGDPAFEPTWEKAQ